MAKDAARRTASERLLLCAEAVKESDYQGGELHSSHRTVESCVIDIGIMIG